MKEREREREREREKEKFEQADLEYICTGGWIIYTYLFVYASHHKDWCIEPWGLRCATRDSKTAIGNGREGAWGLDREDRQKDTKASPTYCSEIILNMPCGVPAATSFRI